nr:MAG TPA: portal protein [Caudoviricetes sp.]
MKFLDRITHAWNVFSGQETYQHTTDFGPSSSRSEFTIPRYRSTEILSSVFSRIAIDCSMVDLSQIKVDENPSNDSVVQNGLNYCLKYEANADQSNIAFMQDLIYSMFDEGVVAVVPTETNVDLRKNATVDILEMRIGKITQWYPEHVKVNLYNPKLAKRVDVVLPKNNVAIIENPFREIVNDSNLTLRRLLDKLAIIDKSDRNLASNKLDIILQMPYATRNKSFKDRAVDSIRNLEEQLTKSPHGIGYIDSQEKVIQLNRPLTNGILEEIKDLKKDLYSQFGITENILNGTANEMETRAYYSRTIDPIITAIAKEFERKFISKTARTQGNFIAIQRDPFKLVPTEQLATMVDTFIRNAVMTPNEARSILGFPPSEDENANRLYNPNMAMDKQVAGSEDPELAALEQQVADAEAQNGYENYGEEDE